MSYEANVLTLDEMVEDLVMFVETGLLPENEVFLIEGSLTVSF